MAWVLNIDGKKMLQNRGKPIGASKSILHVLNALLLNRLCAVVRCRTMAWGTRLLMSIFHMTPSQALRRPTPLLYKAPN